MESGIVLFAIYLPEIDEGIMAETGRLRRD
jgi:hypothetical protein